MRTTRAAILTAFVAGVALALSGCDEGPSSGGGGTADTTGEWTLVTKIDEVEGPDQALRIDADVRPIDAEIDGDPVTVTVSGTTITIEQEIVGVSTTTMTGTVSGTHMEGTFTTTFTAGGSEEGTWWADLVTRALVDVSGDWDIDWWVDGGSSGWATAALTMAADGTITGTYNASYGGPYPVTGILHGYGITLTVVEDTPWDRTITMIGRVNEPGTSTTGTWSDTMGNSGDWDATKP